MIVYTVKRCPTGKLLLKRWIKKRVSFKNSRFYERMKTYRKKWWHFKTRWEIE